MQLKKGFKTVLAVVLSAALAVAPAMSSFAADPTTTAGTGNILDYKIQSQVVPTALKVAINPNGYDVNLRYAALASDATYNAGTKYYKEKDGGGYEVDTSVTSDNFSTKKASLFTAATSDTQIVSFNYGLANKSSVDRKISVSFAVAADENVSFVETAAKATNEAAADDGGAKKGEYKIFLQLVPAKASTTITAATYAKASGTYASSGVYYTKSGTTYTKVGTNNETDFNDGKYYVSTTDIGTEIMASELADVTMEASTAPIAFTAGTGTTSADVAYKLGKATYTLKKDEFIDFSTETDDVEEKFEMTGIGGLSGFTFTGVMNTNTEWSQLETKTITITPTYRFEDATGLETAVDTGLNQVVATPATVATGVAYTSKAANGDVTITFTPGTAAKTLANTSFKINGVETSAWSSYNTSIVFNNDNTITVKAAVFGFSSITAATTDNKYTFVVKDTDGNSYSTAEVTIE